MGDLIDIVEDEGELGDFQISSRTVFESLLSTCRLNRGFDDGVDDEKASA